MENNQCLFGKTYNSDRKISKSCLEVSNSNNENITLWRGKGQIVAKKTQKSDE